MAFFKNTFGGATTTKPAPTSTGGGFFSGVFTAPERKAVSDLNITRTNTATAKSTPQTVEKGQVPTSSIGGTVGFLGDILSTGQYGAMSAIQTALGLEKDKSFKEKFFSKPTGKDVLRQIGLKDKEKGISTPTSKILTGNYEPSESVLKNFFKEIPSTILGTAGDIVLDPLTLLSGLGLVKKGTTAVKEGVVKPTIGALEKTVTGGKIVNKTGELFIPRYGQPELFKSLDRARLAEEQMISSNVDTLVGPTLKQNAEIQTKIAEAIKGNLTDDNVKTFAQPIREELDRLGSEISKINPKLLSPETFENNKGTYFPRMFEKYEIDDPARQIDNFFSTGTRAPKDRFIAKKELPDEVLKELGEIKTAGYPAAKGLTQLKQAEVRSKFFKEVSDNFASDVPSGNLVQLPDSKYLGALSGKFVLPSIAEVVNGTVKTVNPAVQKYLDALGLWKTFKTAYNPATIARNDLTNLFVLNPLGGVPFWDVKTYAKAAKEMLNPGPIYNAARKAGLDISNQTSAELMSKASVLYQKKKGLFGEFFPKVKDFHKAVTNFYGTQDKFFKLANIIKGVEQDGLSITQALNRANFYLVDYSEMPKAVDFLRKSFVPFISFTYGVSRPLAKTLLERPDKLANYFKVLREIQQMNPYQETQDQKLKEYDSLPQYIKDGQFERLPIKDKSGRSLYLDLQYILPFNPVETKSLSPNNPFFEVLSDLKRNKSGFSGKEIWEETDTQAEKNVKALQYTWLQISPNNPLIPSSWSFKKMQDAGIFPRVDNGSLVIEPRPDSLGRERSKMAAVLDSVFGIKLTPIDTKTEQAKRVIEKKGTINDLKSQLFKLMLNKQMLPADKEKQKQNLLDKIKEVSKSNQP